MSRVVFSRDSWEIGGGDFKYTIGNQDDEMILIFEFILDDN